MRKETGHRLQAIERHPLFFRILLQRLPLQVSELVLDAVQRGHQRSAISNGSRLGAHRKNAGAGWGNPGLQKLQFTTENKREVVILRTYAEVGCKARRVKPISPPSENWFLSGTVPHVKNFDTARCIGDVVENPVGTKYNLAQ